MFCPGSEPNKKALTEKSIKAFWQELASFTIRADVFLATWGCNPLKNMVSRVGIEPTTRCLKGSCSTD